MFRAASFRPPIRPLRRTNWRHDQELDGHYRTLEDLRLNWRQCCALSSVFSYATNPFALHAFIVLPVSACRKKLHALAGEENELSYTSAFRLITASRMM